MEHTFNRVFSLLFRPSNTGLPQKTSGQTRSDIEDNDISILDASLHSKFLKFCRPPRTGDLPDPIPLPSLFFRDPSPLYPRHCIVLAGAVQAAWQEHPTLYCESTPADAHLENVDLALKLILDHAVSKKKGGGA